MKSVEIQLRTTNPQLSESISFDLIAEVVKALPDYEDRIGDIRREMQSWGDLVNPKELTARDLAVLEQDLLDYAHTTSDQLGRVGHLPQHASGKIMDINLTEGESISCIVVFALALRRLRTFTGFNIKFMVRPNSGENNGDIYSRG